MTQKMSWLASGLAFALLATAGCVAVPGRERSPAAWTFAVSGDSRNCGNLVMPAIAAGAREDGAAFYWHLGDLRAIYKIDEDFASEQRFRQFSPPPGLGDYLGTAWADFLQHQVEPFGAVPFFLGIGNHEVIAPKTRNQFRIQFRPLLDRPELRAQRARDAQGGVIPATPADATWFHWRMHDVDFINLDNAVGDAFDDAQVAWLDAVLAADLADSGVHSVVVGMHEALPYSRSDSHSMCASDDGLRSGLEVYAKLAQLQRHKPVYVLASHSHYYLADIFDTPHWNATPDSGVLPGWVVGTAGAERYALPDGLPPDADAREKTYGYLLGSVAANGRITFAFRALQEADLQRSRGNDYDAGTVATCMANNSRIEAMRAQHKKENACDRQASP